MQEEDNVIQRPLQLRIPSLYGIIKGTADEDVSRMEEPYETKET